jgi:hypothetical protein
MLRYETHKLFVIRENSLISGSILLLYQFTRRAIKLGVVIVAEYHCISILTKFYLISYPKC